MSGDCYVESCAGQFTRAIEFDKVLVGSNLPYCILVRQYIQCLRRTSKGCRGDLKYHTLYTLLTNENKEKNCVELLEDEPMLSKTDELPTSQYNIGLANGDLNVIETSSRCLFPYAHKSGAAGYRHCGVFGDPHLRTFDGQCETCKTAGAWPLIDNAYLGVQITSEPVGPGLSATFVSKVSNKTNR